MNQLDLCIISLKDFQETVEWFVTLACIRFFGIEASNLF